MNRIQYFIFLDPEDYDLPVLKQPLNFYDDQTKAPEVLHKLNEIVVKADAYFILTAEYNRSLPPPLTNLMDHLPPSRYEIFYPYCFVLTSRPFL